MLKDVPGERNSRENKCNSGHYCPEEFTVLAMRYPLPFLKVIKLEKWMWEREINFKMNWRNVKGLILYYC